jgi:hypothetical protein
MMPDGAIGDVSGLQRSVLTRESSAAIVATDEGRFGSATACERRQAGVNEGSHWPAVLRVLAPGDSAFNAGI